jgi:hypothetical protein
VRTQRSLLDEILHGLPGVDVQIVADPALRRSAGGEDRRDAPAGVEGEPDEAVRTGASP